MEWERRVTSEYAVCELAQEFARRLTLSGAPPHLISSSLQMAIDELEHAKLAAAVSYAVGNTSPPTYQALGLATPLTPDLSWMIADIAVPNLCLGETLATRINRVYQRNATVPIAREALNRVCRDEPRHASLGWQTLDWLLQGPDEPAIRRDLNHRLGYWITDLTTSFVGSEAMPHLRTITTADRQWGLEEPAALRGVIKTVHQDWRQRLGRRGFRVSI